MSCQTRAEEEYLGACEGTRGQYLRQGVSALGGESEILRVSLGDGNTVSLGDGNTVLAVAPRAPPKFSLALGSSLRETHSFSEVVRIIECNIDYCCMPRHRCRGRWHIWVCASAHGGNINQMAHVSMCVDTMCDGVTEVQPEMAGSCVGVCQCKWRLHTNSGTQYQV